MALRLTNEEMKEHQRSWWERWLCNHGFHDWRETGLLPSSDPFLCGKECRRCWLFVGTLPRTTQRAAAQEKEGFDDDLR